MNDDKIGRLATELLRGTLPDYLPDELDAVVGHIGSLLAAANGPGVEQVRSAIGALIDARLFAHARQLALHWNAHRSFDVTVERQLAQVQIELDELDVAEQLLAEAKEKASDLNIPQAFKELSDYQGLFGRIAKQRFVKTNDSSYLLQAVEFYASRFRDRGRLYYHGINVVALVAALERLYPEAPIDEELQLPRLAEEVLAEVTRKMKAGDDSQWALATASEACLALQEDEQAELWLYRFLMHPQTQPFHIESYSRQLREIWGGNALRLRTCADRLSSIIDRHVMRTQKRWSISSAMLKTAREDPQTLEKNFSSERTFTVNTIKKLLERCASIGCVTDVTGRRLGTGFLASGEAFGLGADSGLVFVTNSHVISDTVEDALAPDNAWVTFEVEAAAIGELKPHKVLSQILFTSPPGKLGVTTADKLDFTVVKLASWPQGGLALRMNDSLPTPSRSAKVFVVGHPSGDALQISLHDSELLDVCDHGRLLHYRTPTEPGSSGSPVFNMNWEVVALHHAGSSATPRLHGKGEYEANEGISIRAIRAAAMLVCSPRSRPTR